MDFMDCETTSSGGLRSFSDAYLPDCILSQILLRVPVKFLFRCKCVSKHWQNMISELSFGCSYSGHYEDCSTCSVPWTFLFFCSTDYASVTSNSTRISCGVFNMCYPAQHNLPGSVLEFFEFKQQVPRPFRVLACSSGLVLYRAVKRRKDYVHNPLTKQWVALPRRSQLHKWVSIGFLVDQENSSFHVVRIAEFSGSSSVLDLEIFSSPVGKWIESKLSCDSPVMLSIKHQEAVVYKGILHWREYNNRIIAYDIMKNAHQCRLIDMPKDRDRDAVGLLGASKECFRYLEVKRDPYDRWYLSVWILNNYELGEWALEHQISILDIAHANPQFKMLWMISNFNLRPVSFHPVDPDVVFLVCYDFIVLYNLVTKRLKLAKPDSDRDPMSKFNLYESTPFLLYPWPTPVHKREV